MNGKIYFLKKKTYCNSVSSILNIIVALLSVLELTYILCKAGSGLNNYDFSLFLLNIKETERADYRIHRAYENPLVPTSCQYSPSSGKVTISIISKL